MELWEDGTLDLDAPIQKYCPRFPKKAVDDHNARPALPYERDPPAQRNVRALQHKTL